MKSKKDKLYAAILKCAMGGKCSISEPMKCKVVQYDESGKKSAEYEEIHTVQRECLLPPNEKLLAMLWQGQEGSAPVIINTSVPRPEECGDQH